MSTKYKNSLRLSGYGIRYTASDSSREEAKGKWQEETRFARFFNSKLLMMNGKSLGASL